MQEPTRATAARDRLAEHYELGQLLRETARSRMEYAQVRETGAPMIVQRFASEGDPNAALLTIDKYGNALASAGLPGRLVDKGALSGGAWIAFEQHGQPVSTALRRSRDVELAIAALNDVASALVRLERAGLVHGAIEPRTVFHANHRVTVVGMDRVRPIGAPCAPVTDGDLRYTAPETFAPHRADVRSDVYSLACVAYALLAGGPPVFAVTPETIAEQHRTIAYAELPNASPAWNDLLSAMLAKDPAARPSPSEVLGRASKLRHQLHGTVAAPVVKVPRAAPSGRRPTALLVVLFTLALVGGGAALAVTGGGFGTPAPAASDPPQAAPSAPAPSGAPSAAPASGQPAATAKPATATPPAASAAATPAPTSAGGGGPAPRVTPAPTPAPTPLLLSATPASGPRGTLFRLAAGGLPPGQVFEQSYSTTSGTVSRSVASGVVGSDGVARSTFLAEPQMPPGPYAITLRSGAISRVIIVTITP